MNQNQQVPRRPPPPPPPQLLPSNQQTAAIAASTVITSLQSVGPSSQQIQRELDAVLQQGLVHKSIDRFNGISTGGAKQHHNNRNSSISTPNFPIVCEVANGSKPRIISLVSDKQRPVTLSTASSVDVPEPSLESETATAATASKTTQSVPNISVVQVADKQQTQKPPTRKKWFDDIPDETLRERIVSNMSKEQRTRQEVSYELLVTESDYLQDLRYLLHIYGHRLQGGKNQQRWTELDELFSHIQQLIPVNQVLHEELQKCRRGFVMNSVGEAFLVVADYLKIYTGYCGMHSRLVDYIQRLHKSDSAFKSALKEIYSNSKFNGQNFESYLIKPIQRICKYPLLIREMLKSTPSTHKDWPALDKARQKIEEIVKTVNERTRKIEDMSRTLEICHKIKHGNDLITPTRLFINDGPAIVSSRKCHLFLFNDMLLLCKQSPSLLTGEKYSPYQQIIFETGVHLLDIPESEAFVLVQACANETITLVAMSSVEEKQRWKAAFERIGVCMQGEIGGESRLRLTKGLTCSSSSSSNMNRSTSSSVDDNLSATSAPSLYQLPSSSSRSSTNISELPLSQELLDYYRDRVERSEQEYQDVLKALESIKLSHEEHHRITWELHQRLNEIADLQKALSNAQNYLFDERKQLLKVVGENDNLRLQELKDRKKIRYLLALQSAPEEEETTYFKDGFEKRFVQRSTGASQSANDGSGRKEKEAEMARLEEEDAQTLRLRVKSLEAQLEEQSRLYEEAMEAIKQDQKTTLEECRLRRQYDATKIEELLEKVKKLQDFCRENTKELIEVKKAHKIYERRSKEERTKLLADLSNSRQRLGEEKGRNDTIEKLVETKVSRRNENLISDLRLQVAKFESELMDQKQIQGQLEAAYEKRIEALKTRIQSINNSYKTLKKRRDFEIEGFTSDIQNLRRQLKTLEKHILKSGPIEDRELQLLSIARETGEKAAKISGDLHDLKARLYEAEREVQSLSI